MLLKALTATAAILGASILFAAPASALPGYATNRLEIKAGPDNDYPTVGTARRGAKITINGCLNNWTWCDVSANRDRGWVRGDSIQAVERGRRIPYGAAWSVSTLSFNFGTYWDSNYKGRPFYKERSKWDRHDDNRGPGNRPGNNGRDDKFRSDNDHHDRDDHRPNH